MAERPKVTRGEFEQIECNRCGACCTKLWLPSPLKLAQFLSARESAVDPTPEWLLENDRFIAWLEKTTDHAAYTDFSGANIVYDLRFPR